MSKCVREAHGDPRCVDWCREPRDCTARPLISELLFDKNVSWQEAPTHPEYVDTTGESCLRPADPEGKCGDRISGREEP